MCYSASGSNQSYKHPASCLECVNRGKMIFCFCCCYYLVSSNNVNSVMSPITSGMHHIAFPPLNVPWGKSLALQSTHSPHQSACVMMASTHSLDLCFIFTIIHHSTVITTVRKHGLSLERFELIQLMFVSLGTYIILEGLFLSVAMLLRLVMA